MSLEFSRTGNGRTLTNVGFEWSPGRRESLRTTVLDLGDSQTLIIQQLQESKLESLPNDEIFSYYSRGH
jgi:hypothetical protein